MAAVSPRKADHLRLASGPGVVHRSGTGLEEIRLRHRALPGRDLADVDLGVELLGRRLAAPIVISAMTGGTTAATGINDRLWQAAAEHGVALTLGSGRALLDDESLLRTYGSGPRPPLLLANIGAAQVAPRLAGHLVELLGADGLTIHLNAVQEALQPEGEPDFADVLDRIAATAAALAPLPVVVKEVGFGMDRDDVAQLATAGVAAIDVAGSGGTNWALIEGLRDERAAAVAAAFDDWGVPTAQALRDARAAAPDVPLIASGGLRDGVDVAKSLALGASAGGLARPLLVAAQADSASEAVATVVQQLRVAVWACGAPSAAELDGRYLA